MEVKPRTYEIARARQFFEVKQSPTGGRGVFAKKAIKEGLVGTYPGRVMSEAQFEAAARANPKLETYAVSFFRVKGRELDRGWVITPGGADGNILPAYRDCIAPYINEPPPGGKPNCFWVWNLGAGTVEIHVQKPIPKGNELFLCYGGDYRRDYPSACPALQGSKNVFRLHYRKSSRHRVLPIYVLNNNNNNRSTRQTPSPQSSRASTPNCNSRKRSLPPTPSVSNAKRPRTPPVNALKAEWLHEMRSLLDKAALSRTDVARIHQLRALYVGRKM